MFRPEFITQADNAAQTSVFDRKLSRRSFLCGVAGLAGAGVLAATNPGLLFNEAQAEEEWVYANIQPWQTRQWFPLGSEVANAQGIITLDRPLALFDKLQRGLLGIDSNLQPEFRNFADGYLRRFSGTREWAGFCHGVAHLNLRPEPGEEPTTFILGDGEEVTLTYPDKVGIGAAYRSGDLMYRPFLGDSRQTSSTLLVQENLDWFMERFVTERAPFIISAGDPGTWYRAVWGVSPDWTLLLANNLNAPDKKWIVVPRGKVKEVYYPIPQEVGKAIGVDERLFGEIPDEWRFDDRMDKDLASQALGYQLD
ncbi:MAG: hypothetical protein M1609_01595 [Firmicutes bacterium]|nr:hypothetical protein [Bacillota bacterium]